MKNLAAQAMLAQATKIEATARDDVTRRRAEELRAAAIALLGGSVAGERIAAQPAAPRIAAQPAAPRIAAQSAAPPSASRPPAAPRSAPAVETQGARARSEARLASAAGPHLDVIAPAASNLLVAFRGPAQFISAFVLAEALAPPLALRRPNSSASPDVQPK